MAKKKKGRKRVQGKFARDSQIKAAEEKRKADEAASAKAPKVEPIPTPAKPGEAAKPGPIAPPPNVAPIPAPPKPGPIAPPANVAPIPAPPKPGPTAAPTSVEPIPRTLHIRPSEINVSGQPPKDPAPQPGASTAQVKHPTTTGLEDRTGQIANGLKLVRQAGFGGMGVVYYSKEENAKGLENVAKDPTTPEPGKFQHVHGAAKLIYHMVRGGVHPKRLDIEGLKVDVEGEELAREIAQTAGVTEEIYSRATTNPSASLEIISEARYGGLVEEIAAKICKEGLTERAMREARIQADCIHPFSVMPLYSGIFEDRYCIASEFIHEERKLDPSELGSLGTELPQEAAFMMFYYAAVFFEYMARVVKANHRDAKPDNLMIEKHKYMTANSIILPRQTDHGIEWVPVGLKVADPGLAKHLDQRDSQRLSQTGIVLGTPIYMPYEAFDSDAINTECRDVYSTAATFYHILTGSPPFGGESPTAESVLGDLSNPEKDPIFPSKRRTSKPEGSKYRSKLHPYFESIILRALMKGTRAVNKRLGHRKEFSEYTKPRMTASDLVKALNVVVKKIPAPDFSKPPEYRARQFARMFDAVPLELTSEGRTEIAKIKEDIADATQRLEGLIQGADLSVFDNRLKLFMQHMRLSMGNYRIGDIIPPSVGKEVDTPDRGRPVSFFLGKGESHHDKAVEVMKDILVSDAWNYLCAAMGESQAASLAELVRKQPHIAEERRQESPKARIAQGIRLMETIWRTEDYTEPAKYMRDQFIARAGEYSLDRLTTSEEAFVQFKGRIAYHVFVQDTKAKGLGTEAADRKPNTPKEMTQRDGMILAEGKEAFKVLSKSKDAYVALRGEREYARLILPFKTEENPHARLLESLNDEGKREAFERSHGEAYVNALRNPDGAERKRYIEEEGKAFHRVYLLKRKINPSDLDAHEQLVERINADQDERKRFIEEEGTAAYNEFMRKLEDYSGALEIDELRSRREQLIFEKWMDTVLGREIEKGSSTSVQGIESISKGDIDERVLGTFGSFLDEIMDGYSEEASGKAVSGYKELLEELGSTLTLEALDNLGEQMHEHDIADKFVKSKRAFDGVQMRIEQQPKKDETGLAGIEGIEASIGPQKEQPLSPDAMKEYRTVKARYESVGESMKLPTLLYFVYAFDHRSELEAQLAELQRQDSERPFRLKVAACAQAMQEPKDILTASTKKFSDAIIDGYDNADERIMLRHYREALLEYAPCGVGADEEQFNRVEELLEAASKTNLFNAEGSQQTCGQIRRLFDEANEHRRAPEVMERLKGLIDKAKKVSDIKAVKDKIGRIYYALGMNVIAESYYLEGSQGKG